MKAILTGLLVFLGLTLMMAGCGNKGDEVDLNPLPIAILSDTSYFPNKIGYWWKYRVVTDEDTSMVMVRITGDTTVNGETNTIWKYFTVGENGQESLWFIQAVCTAEDTIRMTNFINGVTQILIMPVVIGASWVNPLDDSDSTFVLGMEEVYNDSTIYYDAYHLVRYRQVWVYSYEYDYWFKSKVGMVRIREFSSWTGPVGNSEATWDLIERHLWLGSTWSN